MKFLSRKFREFFKNMFLSAILEGPGENFGNFCRANFEFSGSNSGVGFCVPCPGLLSWRGVVVAASGDIDYSSWVHWRDCAELFLCCKIRTTLAQILDWQTLAWNESCPVSLFRRGLNICDQESKATKASAGPWRPREGHLQWSVSVSVFLARTYITEKTKIVEILVTPFVTTPFGIPWASLITPISRESLRFAAANFYRSPAELCDFKAPRHAISLRSKLASERRFSLRLKRTKLTPTAESVAIPEPAVQNH